jgi:phosphate transport system substrate-binding protein
MQSKATAETLRVGGTGSGLGLLKTLGDAFSAEHPETKIEVVPSLGTTGGIAALADGAIDVAVAARPLKPDEAEAGVREIAAARTPFVLVTAEPHPDSISASDVAALFARPEATWPNGMPVRVVLRPASETDTKLLQEFFPGMTEALAAARARPEIPVAPTDQDSATLAEAIVGSLASSTLVQITTERRALRALPINGVAPTLENLESGAYPYAKTLYFAIGARPAPMAQAFAEFLSSDAASSIMRQAGILPAGL